MGSATKVKSLNTVTLLKILALGQAEVAAGKVRPLKEVVARLRKRRPKAK